MLIDKVNDILKYEFHKNGFVFIVQDHEWTLPNGSLDCSLFYKDSLHLVEQGNVKLAKSIVSTLTARSNQINFSSKNRNTLYSDVSKQYVPGSISFSFMEDDFSPLTNVYRPVSKSGNCSIHVTARSIVVSSNVSRHVKLLYRCKPVKAACSRNVSKQNVCNVSSVSKLVKPLTVSKPVCSTIVSKSNICKVSLVSQHVKPLDVNKSMSSCNVPNRNVHIVNSISHHTKPLSVGKSDCSCNASKPVICKSSNISVCKIINNRQVFNPIRDSVVVNLSKRGHKRSFNDSSHKHGVTKSLSLRNILMTSIYFYELVLLFVIFRHNFCNGNFDNFFKGYVTRNNFS